ncbi:alpha/beta hydrolase [Jatrophihabitans telluris]|uniref:Alpha/beta hydrolase n=1 Tax=Jatrophihabitans telluris TaxID=2038343 RepID=A0ABY4R3P3_9ACTN|nr:alpha/beta hydrolase [Jatrophihabitans telluris]UQX89715.1 alpha/beta hydrolase [Jatrophihabitans telluris]
MSPTAMRIARSRRPVRSPRPAELAGAQEFPLTRVDSDIPPWPGDYETIAGTDVFIRKTPSTAARPEPALYVHGLGGASTNFTDLADLLSPYFDGHALDLPGFGRSGAPASDRYTIQAHTDVVIEYLRRTDRGPVHLVGNSMGGAIAIRLAATRPDLVRTLTLISPAVPDLRPRQGGDLLLPMLMMPGIGVRALRKLDQGSPKRRAMATITLCFAHPELVPQNRIAEAAEDVLLRRDQSWAHDAMLSSLRGIARMYLTHGRNSAWRLMSRIEAPTVVVWGQQDKLVHVSNAPKVATAIADATLLVLPEIGHVAQLEDPAVTARAILALTVRGSALTHGRGNERQNSSGVGA